MNIKLNTHILFLPDLEYKKFDRTVFNGSPTDLNILHDSLAELICFIAERMAYNDIISVDDIDFINDIYFELFGHPYIAKYGGKYMFVALEDRKQGLLKVIGAINYIAAAIEPLRSDAEYERKFYAILSHYKKCSAVLYERAEHIEKFLNK